MKTGNLKNLRVNGALQLTVTRSTGCEGYLPVGPDGATWSAAIEGWHRGTRNVGTGGTRESALRDLAKQCGTTVDELLAACNVLFPERLLSLRKGAKMTVQELADAAGLSKQAVHMLEAGQRAPSLETARKLAEAMGKTLAAFE